MKNLIFSFLLLFVSLVVHSASQNTLAAESCAIKLVCIDEKHTGIQTPDCRIISSNEMLKTGKSECTIGCTEGKCILDNETPTCEDSDGGKKYFRKGKVKHHELGARTEAEDYCYDAHVLVEMGCQKNTNQNIHSTYILSLEDYTCPNGCKDGACVKMKSTDICEDTDGDGILDVNEEKHRTDPTLFDTDDDGFPDGEEIHQGWNPTKQGK